ADNVDLVLDGDNSRIMALKKKDGYYSVFVKGLKAGTLYGYRLGDNGTYPDPCSLFQPKGPMGPSMVIDHREFKWTDKQWNGPKKQKNIVYELHIGTFTNTGTFIQATQKLEQLKWLGVTILDVMPGADAFGRWGWGYDGVNMFATNHNYGPPDSFKFFIDKAHSLGLAVILDVVYHHFGTSGNFIKAFSGHYFTDKYKNEWGQAINFHGKNARYVREFFIQNACYWINDFHLDGLRFDAAQNLYDMGKEHIIARIVESCRRTAGARDLFFLEENNEQQAFMVRPLSEKGYGIDAAWAEDFYKSAYVAITGKPEGYASDYKGNSQELISAIKNGYLFQGQYSRWIDAPLGTEAGDLPAESFLFFLQNHDQIANSITGRRISEFCPKALYRTLAALLFLSPENVLIFMGQEFGSTTPFTFFAEQETYLKKAIWKGRKRLIGQFKSFRKFLDDVPDPYDQSSFLKCKLDDIEHKKNKVLLNFHRDLFSIRKNDPIIS
ncbi:MAG TPA: alpha-amylase family glycosyl hydrolase, partial [Candidatus Omnitrophota bacterium]|nr:alpha-amylase family glycosyl hydrolase [Candidatus Omnitrophota bacterium]